LSGVSSIECAAEAFEFKPAGWVVGGGAKEGVKVEAAEGALKVTMPATATNQVQLTYSFGKTPLELKPYQCLEVTLESDQELAGGEFRLIPVGWGAGGGGRGFTGGTYKSKNPASWSFQRAGLIGCFHRGKDQQIALQVNPRENIPAGKTVTIRANLAEIYARTPAKKCMSAYLRLPANKSGAARTVTVKGVRILDDIPDDPAWLAKAKAADAELAALKTDYSDSSKMLQPPADHRFVEPFAVVRGGKPAAEIVLAPETKDMPALKTAAEELQKWIEAVTGVQIPVSADGERKRGVGGVAGLELGATDLNRICLGKRLVPSYRKSGWFANDGWNEILAKLSGRDGYAIRLDPENPKNLHVFGVKDKGTLNGVFALLENNTDIIWSRPNEKLGTVYTKVGGDFSLVWGNEVVDVPDSETRGWNTFQGVEWMARNKCNLFNGGGGGDIEWTNPGKAKWGVDYMKHLGGHNIFHFLKGETDPTLFAHNDEGVRTGGNPCWTNPRTLAAFTSNVLNCARMQFSGPGKLYINLQDTWKSCLCKNCRAAFTAPDGTHLDPTDENFYSTRYFMFMNMVAEALVKEMPEKQIVTLAYFGSLPAPACAIHPAITPEWAPYPRVDDKKPIFHPENRLHMEHLENWFRKLGPGRIEVYGYWGLGQSFWRPVADAMAIDFRLLNRWTRGCSSEVPNWKDEDWDSSGIELWTMTRLYWNPYQDPDQLRKYYIRRTFREAAPAIEKFYGEMRRAYYTDTAPEGISGGFGGIFGRMVNRHGLTGQLRGSLDEAAALVRNPQSAELVKRLRARFDLGCETVEKAKSSKGKK
jgi:hypothetical protein